MNLTQEEPPMNAQQAQTTLNQLGGINKIHAMTGAKDFARDEAGQYVSFKFLGCKTANYIKITLTWEDLYEMEFGKLKKWEYEVVKSINGVYAEDLKRIFEDTTGLALSL
jgi:hypothetical protein